MQDNKRSLTGHTLPPVQRGIFSGESALARMKVEEEKATERDANRSTGYSKRVPFRYRLPAGKSSQFIILDTSPLNWCQYEHNLQDSTGKWSVYTGCVREMDDCPICREVRESSYVMYLTVLDLSEYTNKAGDLVEFSRKLFVVKPKQRSIFVRHYNRRVEEGLTLRGALFETTRNGPKDPVIGNDFFLREYVPEEELAQFTGKWTDKEGKEHVENCFEAYNYADFVVEPTTQDLRKYVKGGGSPVLGSKEHEHKVLSSKETVDADDWQDFDDENTAPWGEPTNVSATSKEEQKPVATPTPTPQAPIQEPKVSVLQRLKRTQAKT